MKKLIMSLIVVLMAAMFVSCNVFAEDFQMGDYDITATYTVQDSYVIQIPERLHVYGNADNEHYFNFDDVDLAENHSLYIDIANLGSNNDIFLKSKSPLSSTGTGAHMNFRDNHGQPITNETDGLIGEMTNEDRSIRFMSDIIVDDGVRAGECEGVIKFRFRIGTSSVKQ